MNDRFYDFYNSELEALCGLGGHFAERRPKSAARLRLKRDDDFPDLIRSRCTPIGVSWHRDSV